MRIFSSCDDSAQYCLNTRTFAIAHLYNYEPTMNIHLHDFYEIYFSISGGRQFLINNRLYDYCDCGALADSFAFHHGRRALA